MPEQLTSPEDLSAQVTPESDLTYDKLLDEGIHPDLRPHVVRLAAKHNTSPTNLDIQVKERPAITRVVEDMKSQRDKIATSNLLDRAPSVLPKYYTPSDKAVNILASGEMDKEQLKNFIHEARLLSEAYSDSYSNRFGHSENPDYVYVLRTLEATPIDTLRDIYHSPDDSQDLHHMLASCEDIDSTRPTLKMLQRIYGYEDVLDLFDPENHAAKDPLVQSLLERKRIAYSIGYELHNERSHLWPEGMDPAEASTAKRDWGDRFLDVVAGLPKENRDELQFAAYSRTSNPDTGFVDANLLRTMLSNTAYNVREVGVEKTQKLREKAGIVNIDYYDTDHLSFTADVVDGDEKAIKHLQEGDTTVVFTDAKGDFSGAFSQVAYDFDTPNKRTLFFEISQPSDFYRHMLLLKKLGIKPSTLVQSMHGFPGVMQGGKGDGTYSLVNNSYGIEIFGPPKQHRLGDSFGLPRIVSEMMQDSRGIDDNPQAIGRRRIILNSCNQAKPAPVIKYEMRERRGILGKHNGKTEFVAVDGLESTAETITRIARHPRLDVYGVDRDFVSTRTASGIEIKEFVETAEGASVGDTIEASHLRLDENGNVIETRVQEITLRRTENKHQVNEESHEQ